MVIDIYCRGLKNCSQWTEQPKKSRNVIQSDNTEGGEEWWWICAGGGNKRERREGGKKEGGRKVFHSRLWLLCENCVAGAECCVCVCMYRQMLLPPVLGRRLSSPTTWISVSPPNSTPVSLEDVSAKCFACIYHPCFLLLLTKGTVTRKYRAGRTPTSQPRNPYMYCSYHVNKSSFMGNRPIY